MALLGGPLNYNRSSRRDVRYRWLQSRVYNFLERPRGLPAILYHMIVFCMVFTCLALSVFSTIEEYEKDALYILFRMELLVVIWFTIEFVLRLWSSGCRSRYQGCLGRLKFLKRPFCIIDIVTIVASVVVLGMGSSGQVFATSALRGLRFFQILRMVRMDRRGGTWKLLGSVVYAHRQELITTMYIGFLGLIFASFLVYLMEKDINAKFNNFAQALWWGVITLCTVGYGDMVPETWQGKLIASFCALLGISFFALPAGILGSGFALKVQQQQRQKHMIRRRQPAATLIQSLWRCYAADEHSISIATWKIHQMALPSPPASRASSSFKHNASFVARLPTIRRNKSQSIQTTTAGSNGVSLKAHTPSSRISKYTRTLREINHSVENLEAIQNGRLMKPSFSEDSVADPTLLLKKYSDDEDEESCCMQLTNQHKVAIRFIRKLKYFVARRKFKEALKPYDVKDVMEQYAAGHVDLLGRVKNVHTRLDQILGKQGSKTKDVYASKISLASRVVKIERQVADIEEKLDILIKAYMEDRQRFQLLPLNQAKHSDNSQNGRLTQHQVNFHHSGSWQNFNTNANGGPINIHNNTTNTTNTTADYKKSSDRIDSYGTTANMASSHIENNQHTGIDNVENKLKKKVTLKSNSYDGKNQMDDIKISIPNIEIRTTNSDCRFHEISGNSVIMIDEYEDLEEEDLNCVEEEIDQYPVWEIDSDIVADADVDADCDQLTENTALLQTKTRTSIVITPTSTVHSMHNTDDQTGKTAKKSDLLSPHSTG